MAVAPCDYFLAYYMGDMSCICMYKVKDAMDGLISFE